MNSYETCSEDRQLFLTTDQQCPSIADTSIEDIQDKVLTEHSRLIKRHQITMSV